MDIRYALQGILFEWDAEKATANFKKHQVSFATACEAFFDPFVYLLDEEQHGDEHRETLIGMTLQWNVLCVVYTVSQTAHPAGMQRHAKAISFASLPLILPPQ